MAKFFGVKKRHKFSAYRLYWSKRKALRAAKQSRNRAGTELGAGVEIENG